MHFVLFVYAVASHWIVLMSGVGAVGLAIYERVRRGGSEWLFWPLAALFLFLAFFLAWNEQFDRAELLQSKIGEHPIHSGGPPIAVSNVASVEANGKDLGFTFVALPVVGSATLAFGTPFTNPPQGCHAEDETHFQSLQVHTTAQTLTVSPKYSMGGDHISVSCPETNF
jgi:hypothetical protein